jgi:hypothetical protein
MQHTDWHKSSYSGGSGENCVEERRALESGAVTQIDIRDSKQADGPVITVSPAAWTALVGSVTA